METEKKNVVCPKCKEALTELLNVQSGASVYSFDGKQYEEKEFHPDSCVNNYECPSCNEVLALNEKDAIALLKGEGEVK